VTCNVLRDYKNSNNNDIHGEYKEDTVFWDVTSCRWVPTHWRNCCLHLQGTKGTCTGKEGQTLGWKNWSSRQSQWETMAWTSQRTI